MHAGHRSALCLVSYLRLRPLGDLGGGWIGLMVFVCSRPQHSQLCTQRLSPGSAFTGADIDPDLHSHFQSHFAKLLLYITHIRTLNGHIGHTYTCRSFADQGGMQVAEDKWSLQCISFLMALDQDLDNNMGGKVMWCLPDLEIYILHCTGHCIHTGHSGPPALACSRYFSFIPLCHCQFSCLLLNDFIYKWKCFPYSFF